MHQVAQVELIKVQKRGNHGTLSTQLNNEKSIPLIVFILDIMFSVPVAELLAPSAMISPAQLPPHAGIPAWDSLSQRDRVKTAYKYVSR